MDIDQDVHDRQKRVAGWNQEKISGARCLVVGAGALGNEVVKNLVQFGVREMTIVDYDEIVAANLNRCVFFGKKDADEKRLKAEVLAERAAAAAPGMKIGIALKKIEELPEDFYSNFDYAFGCLDNLGARLHLNAQAYGKVPLIDGGTTGFMGKVQVVAGQSSCLECGVSKRDYNLLWKKYSCVGEVLDFLDPKMPALPTTTGIVASIQANEFAKMVHGNELAKQSLAGKYLFFNGLTGRTEVFEVPKRKKCPVHAD